MIHKPQGPLVSTKSVDVGVQLPGALITVNYLYRKHIYTVDITQLCRCDRLLIYTHVFMRIFWLFLLSERSKQEQNLLLLLMLMRLYSCRG